MLDLPHKSVGFSFSADASLPALKGVGLQYVDTPEYRWDNRRRADSHCVVQYTLAGEGAVEAAGVTWPVPAGSALMVDIPGDNSYFLPESSPSWEFVFFEFTKECLPYLRKVYAQSGPVVNLAAHPGLGRRMLGIYRQALGPGFPTVFDNAKAAFGLWMDLSSAALQQQDPSPADAAKRFIDQSYRQPDLGLAQIAGAAGLSPYHLCRAFKSRFGTTPGRYLREVRVAQACRLLLTTAGYTMQQVAEQVGYANANYFGKVFKAEKGMSPAAWRKQSNRYDMVQAVYETNSPPIKQV